MQTRAVSQGHLRALETMHRLESGQTLESTPMVRPERDRAWTARRWCCIRLAGESPVAVRAGAPRSRLRAQGEIRTSKRSVESPGAQARVGASAFCPAGLDTGTLRDATRASSARRDDPSPGSGERVMRRTSVSRVREIRLHGLKGGFRSPDSQEHRA
jgi:hypothetical protein